MDLQGSFSFLFGGAGWRLGAKYQLLKKGPLAGAVMLGYGKYSAAGTNTYNTNSGVVDVNQTLSVRQIDLSFPVSYRLGGIIPYSGLNIYNSSVEGSAANTYVSDGFTDFGVNLGVKFPIGAMFELDAEGAVLSVSDPFQGSRRMVIYYGLAGAVIF